MKKFLSILTMLLLLFSSLTSAFAYSGNNEVDDDLEIVYEAQQITDDNEVLERAKKGVNEGPVTLIKKVKGSDNSSTVVYETTQKLKEKKSKKENENKTVTSYVTTIVAESTYKSDNNYDNTYSARVYIEYHYDMITTDNVQWVEAVKYRYKYVNLDSQVTATQMKNYYGCGGQQYENKSKYWVNAAGSATASNPTSGIWYYNTPSTDWGHVNVSTYDGYNGMNVRTDLKRSTSTWYFQIDAGFGSMQPLIQ
ncbi:hypothetical protein [Brevibacillus sp. H7]|uniref:hypothetical protein n=1 Tax=Brevibacillus sp. H7 TaxID=3349138 RepID=UPI00381ABA25